MSHQPHTHAGPSTPTRKPGPARAASTRDRSALTSEERAVSELVCGQGLSVAAACERLSMSQDRLAGLLASALDKMAADYGLAAPAAMPRRFGEIRHS